MWFASRLCRYRWAKKNGRLYDISPRERREIEGLGETNATSEKFVAGLFADPPLDEAAADEILRERIENVFAEHRNHSRKWRPADDSPAAEIAIREMAEGLMWGHQ
jgi:hypothetical protein